MRHKGDNSGISSVAELDHHIRLIGRLDMAIEENSNAMDIEIQATKQRYLEHKGKLQVERNALLTKCQLFVAANREALLGSKKSLNLNFGKVGFRKLGDKIGLPKPNTEEMEELVATVERLQELEPDRFGKIEVSEAKWIAKAQINGLADEDLGMMGLKRSKGKDEFFVDPDRSRTIDAELDLGQEPPLDSPDSPPPLTPPARGGESERSTTARELELHPPARRGELERITPAGAGESTEVGEDAA